MTRRLRFFWHGVALIALLALSAAPVMPQGTPVPVTPPEQGAQPPPRPPERPARVPRARRGETPGRPGRVAPPLPGGQPGQLPGQPQVPGQAGTPTSPPTRLELVQGGTGQQEIRMEVYDLDLDHLLRLLSSAAGVTITKTEAVKGKVTIIAPVPVPLDVAFQILDSVLQMRGYAMIRDGTGLYKILPMNEAAQSGLPVNFSNNPEEVPDTSQLICQVVELRNLAADQVAAEIASLLSAGVGGGGQPGGAGMFTARVVPTTTNALIITDTAANVKRALTIIADMEQQLSGGYRIYRLQNYDASTMADVINTLVLGRGGGGGVTPGVRRQPWEQRVAQGVRPGPGPQPGRVPTPTPTAAAMVSGAEFVFPDTKTNSLVVQATPAHLDQISRLVDQLDKPVDLKGSFVVYPVQNLIASDLAQRIGQHLGIQVNVTQAAGAAAAAGRAGARAGRGAAGLGGQGLGGRTSLRGGGMFTPGGQTSYTPYRSLSVPDDEKSGEGRVSLAMEPLAASSNQGADPLQVAQAPDAGGALPALPAAPTMPAPEGAGAEVEPVISPTVSGTTGMITADDNTNTIMVTAPPEQADLIQSMLEKLDVLPPQVYIQAIIAEVSLGSDNSLGFEWDHLLATLRRDNDQFEGTFGTNFGLGSRDDSGNLVGIAGSGLSGFITGPNGFAAVLNALKSDSNVRILSTPSIFTSNNEEGMIQVGTQIPFPTSSTTTPTGTGTGITSVITQSVSWQTVGIQLFVTPRVTQGDVVNLDVEVSANDVGASIRIGGQDYPTTLQRQAGAILSVKDSYTVVMGGLMRDSVSHTSSKVPILGEIPLVGALFRSSRIKVDKTELLVFLTPRVVRSAAEAAQVSEEQKSKLPEVPKSLQKPSDPTLQDPAKKR